MRKDKREGKIRKQGLRKGTKHEIFTQHRNDKCKYRQERQFCQVYLCRQQDQEKSEEEGKIMVQILNAIEATELKMCGKPVFAVTEEALRKASKDAGAFDFESIVKGEL